MCVCVIVNRDKNSPSGKWHVSETNEKLKAGRHMGDYQQYKLTPSLSAEITHGETDITCKTKPQSLVHIHPVPTFLSSSKKQHDTDQQ